MCNYIGRAMLANKRWVLGPNRVRRRVMAHDMGAAGSMRSQTGSSSMVESHMDNTALLSEWTPKLSLVHTEQPPGKVLAHSKGCISLVLN